MFFILSKILLIFILPFTWIFVAFCIALLSKKAKLRKWSLISGFSLLVLFTNPLLLNLYARAWDINERPVGNKQYSSAIILGGFVSSDKEDNGFFNQAADRFIQGALLKTTGKAKTILLTGGNASLIPGEFSESIWAAKQLKALNIDTASVLIESDARNTLENAQLSQKLLLAKKLPPPYLLVTSAFHMRRSLLTFKKAGVDVVPFSCHYLQLDDKISLDSFIPDAGVLGGWNTYIKELVGYVVYSLK
jgi:uncharacterized SAM-binding protein YcdF (DUF218 family)